MDSRHARSQPKMFGGARANYEGARLFVYSDENEEINVCNGTDTVLVYF